jgi:Domain of unknown function (DUF4124)
VLQMRLMRTLLTALCLASTAASAQTIYTWTDETGTVHYTDTLSSVPQGVKVDTTQGEELSIVSSDASGDEGASAQKPQVVAQAPQPPARPGIVATSVITGEPLDEYQWRGRFRTAHAEVQSLEDELAIDKKRLAEPGGYGPGILCGGGYGYGGGTIPTAQVPQAYRATSQIAAMQARATLQPAPGVTLSGEATVRTAPVPPPVTTGYGYRGGYLPSCIATPNPDYERMRDRVERNTAALKRAKDALDDLDRQASHHGVPREWRRP